MSGVVVCSRNEVVFGLAMVTVLQWESSSGVIRINVWHCRLCLVEFRNDFLFHFTVCFGSQSNVMACASENEKHSHDHAWDVLCNHTTWDATTLMSHAAGQKLDPNHTTWDLIMFPSIMLSRKLMDFQHSSTACWLNSRWTRSKKIQMNWTAKH
jgi:hypothetical protein